jgi:hypothetical protein
MGLKVKALEDRVQHRATGPDVVGQGRQAERSALPGVVLGLAIERLMLPNFLERRPQTGKNPI